MKNFLGKLRRSSTSSKTSKSSNKPMGEPFPGPGLDGEQLVKPMTRQALIMQFVDAFVASNDWRNAHIPKHKPGNGMLRIASYNLHGMSGYAPGTGGAGMVQTILKINADIICLQECPFEFPAPIMKMYPYSYTRAAKIGNHKMSWGNAILSRYELSLDESMDYDDGSTESRNFVSGCVPLEGSTALRVICTHFDVHDESGKTRLREAEQLSEFGKSPPHSVENSVKSTKSWPVSVDPANTIILGDFNAVHRPDYSAAHWDWIEGVQDKSRGIPSTDTTVMDSLINVNGWRDALRSYNGGMAPCVTTWSLRRVDFILMHPEYNLPEPAGTYVYYSNASDHLPVIVDIPVSVAV